MDNLKGKVVKGYELRELIGMGGFGVVYRAYQSVVDREVAIKIILPKVANQASFIRNFEAEARLIARLEHFHIVPLYDFWREPNGAYIVTRLLRGGSLQDSIKKNGPWPADKSARLIEQIAVALTVAHRNGIIHQDIKAANILLDDEDNAYLTDFGIAKDLSAPVATSTEVPESQEEDVLHGSPEYMAPEQILRSAIDARTDVYSLGIVLFEMLTGQKPFESKNDDELIRKQLYDPLPRLQDFRPELSDSLNMVIQRATDKSPRRRYATPLKMAENFRQFIAVEQETAEQTPKTTTPTLEARQPAKTTLSMEELLYEPPNPYKGLRAFQEEDSADFFGRNQLAESLYQRVRIEPEAMRSGDRLLAVVGPSGSGKSSVVKAGLIPYLRRHSSDWVIQQITPSANPFQEVESALYRVAHDEEISLGAMLREDKTGLHRAVDCVLGDFLSEMVLVIDQFEEVFTQTQEPERQQFIDSLIYAVTNPDSRLRVILTLRADFYDRPLRYQELGGLLQRRTEVVLPMSTAELKDAITKPAERVGLKLEEGLVEEIIADLGNQPGMLPLLQFALSELFMNRRGVTLTLKAYRTSGGVSGAMTRSADELYLTSNPDQKAVTQKLFLRLITPGEGTEDTRRRVTRQELLSLEGDRQLIQQVLDLYGRRRLLSFDHEQGTRAPTVEIAHEALIRNWMLLRKWMDENREALRMQRQLTAAAAEWTNSGRDASFLAAGARLVKLESITEASNISLSADEKAYLEASMMRRERQRQRRSLMVAGLFVFSLFALSLAVVAFDGQNRATMAERESRSRELANASLLNAHEVDLAALLAVESFNAAETRAADNQLLLTLQRTRSQQATAFLETYLHGHDAWVRDVAYSPVAQRAATADESGVIWLWDTQTLQPVGDPLMGHTGTINSLAFSEDGTRLISGGEDAQIGLWDVESGALIEWLSVDAVADLQPVIWSVAANNDGSLIAAGGADARVYLWRVDDGEAELTVLEGHTDAVYAVAFSPDAGVLASGGGDNRVMLWDLSADTEEPRALTGHTNWVSDLAFSPEGDRLLSSSWDRTLRVWDVQTGEALAGILTTHTDALRGIAFSPDGRMIASAGFDGMIALHDTATLERLDDIHVPLNVRVWDVVFTRESDRLLAAANDNAVLVWSLQDTAPPIENVVDLNEAAVAVVFDGDGRVRTVTNAVDDPAAVNMLYAWSPGTTSVNGVAVEEAVPTLMTAVALSEDGSILAMGSIDGGLFIADAETGALLAGPFAASDTGILSVAFNRELTLLAVGDVTGAIHLWQRDEETGEWSVRGEPLTGHLDRVISLSFNANGDLLASGSRDNTVWVWNVAEGTALHESLRGHEDAVTSLAFSPDGRVLASGGRDNLILLRDMQEIDQIRRLSGHLNWVFDLEFQADGSRLASASRDNAVILWDLEGETARQLADPLLGHREQVNAVDFSTDGRWLASAGEDGRVILWDLLTQDWAVDACALANRDLTPAEWALYLPGYTYRPTCNQLINSQDEDTGDEG